jgi:regulatory protein
MSRHAAEENPAVAARRAAMDLLARREHSSHELLQKLQEKFPDFSREEILVPVLRKLRDDKLQSDSRFAEAYVRYRSTRGFGPLKIAAELQPRQLERELVRSVLYEQGPHWEELCLEALHRKFRVDANAPATERQRWQRFLLQRGFTPEQIRAAFKTLGRAAEE